MAIEFPGTGVWIHTLVVIVVILINIAYLKSGADSLNTENKGSKVAWIIERIIWVIFYLPQGPVKEVTRTNTHVARHR